MFFTEATLEFWRGLSQNNSKAWFDEHRKDYERHLRTPYLAFAEALCEQIAEVEPEYELPAKHAVYRINRDVRFSNDKSPYKLDLGVTVGRGIRHDETWPVYTCRVGLSGVSVAGGLYRPPKELRDGVRRWIAANGDAVRSAIADPEFRRYFDGLEGEAHKRPLPDLKEVAADEPLVLNKQWIYWGADSDAELLVRPELDQYVRDRWEAARPVMDVLKRAVAETEEAAA